MRRKQKEENFDDIEEFNNEEEKNMQTMLESRKYEDENLEVYLIEAEEVRDADDEDETIRNEIGDDTEDDDEEDVFNGIPAAIGDTDGPEEEEKELPRKQVISEDPFD